ncbi:RICIN domain-containing protein [Mucilaginibacter sp. CSA2-8R]|uniref:RICIN domain-containing protein n=1 Tax=Mucilaginibacter sp. CSA2-8R TaxID=3141542 RepID=UPI00315CAE68
MEVSGDVSANAKYQNHQTIDQWQAVGNDDKDSWQRWYVIYVNTVNGVKYYHFRNSFSGQVLESPNITAGDKVWQARTPLSGYSDNQLWSINQLGSANQYTIVNKGTGLSIANPNASATNGTAVIQELATKDDRQKWVFTQRSPGTYRDELVNRIFERNLNSQGSVAFDEGTSIPLTWGSNAGKVLWITQDAYDGATLQPNGKFVCGQFFNYGNSFILQNSINDSGSSGANITRNGAKQVVDKQPNSNFAWPDVGVELGQHVYIHVAEGVGFVGLNSQSIWDFTESSGNEWSGTRLTPPGVNQTDINYCNGMVKYTDGYVYAFGGGLKVDGMYVARFSQSNPNVWTFWNGSAWASTPTTNAAAAINIGKNKPGAAVAYCNGKWVMMYLSDPLFCNPVREVYVASSTNMMGPFSDPVTVHTIQENINNNKTFYYTPTIHTEYVNGRNELLLGYSLNYDVCGQGPCTDGFKDPYYYRPKFIRVPYSKIGL